MRHKKSEGKAKVVNVVAMVVIKPKSVAELCALLLSLTVELDGVGRKKKKGRGAR